MTLKTFTKIRRGVRVVLIDTEQYLTITDCFQKYKV